MKQENNKEEISLCKSCYCMTKTKINGICAKCNKKKKGEAK